MNKRDAYVHALRCVAQIAESSIGAGFDPADNDQDNERVYAAMRRVCDQLERRADAMERRSPVRPLPLVEYR